MIPGLRRSPGEGKDYPLQYSGLENSMDCIVHGVVKGRTRLSNFHTKWNCLLSLSPSKDNSSNLQERCCMRSKNCPNTDTPNMYYDHEKIPHTQPVNNMWILWYKPDPVNQSTRQKVWCLWELIHLSGSVKPCWPVLLALEFKDTRSILPWLACNRGFFLSY